MNKYNSNGIDYEMITVDEFNNLEKKWQKDSRSIPYECYVAKTNDGQYLAMDNSTGECFVDEFSSKVLVDEFFTDSLGYDDNYSNIQKIETKRLYY